MGSWTGTVVARSLEFNPPEKFEITSGHDTWRQFKYFPRDLLQVTLGGDFSSFEEDGFSVGDSLRIVQCDGEEKEDDWEEVGDVLAEATHLYGDKFFFGVWRVWHDRWAAGFYNSPCDYVHPIESGVTPLEAAQNLLEEVKRRKGFLVDPHGEGWDADKCREWLDERGRLEEGATPLWRFEAALYERKGSGDCIAYRSNKSQLEVLRDLVVAVNEKQQEAK